MPKFVSAGAAHSLVQAIAAREGESVEGSFGAVGAMLAALRAGETCDIVILTRAQIETLASEGRVVAATVADIGRVPTAIAVRAGDSVPDVASELALRAALLAADGIYFPDPSKATAGIHFAKVIDLLGVREQVATKLRVFPNGATAMRAMAEASGQPIGCTQATEILATRGVQLVAPLPRGFELETTYTAAVSAGAEDAARAARFVTALTGPSSLSARRAAGFAAAA